MKYTQRSFSVGGYSRAFAEGWERMERARKKKAPERCRCIVKGKECGGEIGPVTGGSSHDPNALGCYRCLSHWPEMRWCVPKEKREPLRPEDYGCPF